MDPPPPPSPHTSSATSFPILLISILGILTTAILLLSYYIFLTRCHLNWRRPSLILFRTLSPATPRRRLHNTIHSSPTELHGLDPSSIRSIPIIRFSHTITRNISSHECAVCLNEFHEEESLRLLPACSHAFHIDCIDVWLQSNANCPICRSEISTTISFPFPLDQEPYSSTGGADHTDSHVVIDVKDDVQSKKKRVQHVSSMGDECIDGIRAKDERFLVQPMRRSFSMDSCNDRQLYVAMQEILRQNPEMVRGGGGGGDDGGGGSGGGGRVRRPFFSFGHGRSWRKGVLPVETELQ